MTTTPRTNLTNTSLSQWYFDGLTHDNVPAFITKMTQDWDQALDRLDGVETVTSGNLSVALYLSQLSITGTQAFTLPNGTYTGQRKKIMVTVAASTPLGTLTITTPDATAGYVMQASILFDTVAQGMELLWTGSAWRCVAIQRAGGVVNNVVVGTTLLNTNPMWSTLYCSVTGTVNSTAGGTKGIPNGFCVGDVLLIACSTAASIPSGTLGFAVAANGLTLAGAASTSGIATFGATTNTIAIRWNGVAWQQVGASATLAIS